MVNEGVRVFDVAIVGGGPAGLSAALWCDELGLSAALLEAGAEAGGQLLRTFNPILNHLGCEAADGRELADSFRRQIESRHFELRLRSAVDTVDLDRKQLFLSDGMQISARAVIIATGVRRRRLGVPGESEFTGRGIIESGKRDAHHAAGKNAVIVGGGDAALENAIILSEFAESVTVVHRGRDFRAREEFVQAAQSNPKVTLLNETVVRAIAGEDRLREVLVEHTPTGRKYAIGAEILLLRIGVEPNTSLFSEQLKLDTDGYILVDSECATSVTGVYAAGDVANPVSPTVSSAVGMGATAAKAIFSLLKTA